MSCNREGKAEFCPGCPNRGNYVGPVTKKNICSIGNSEGSSGTDYRYVPDHGLLLVFKDEDELESDGPIVIMEPLDSETKINNIDHEIDEISNKLGESVIGRIALCNGASSDGKGRTECPAFNQTVTEKLITKLNINARVSRN